MMKKLLFPKSHVLNEQNWLTRLLSVDIEYRMNLPAILRFIMEFNLINYINSFHFMFNQMETQTTMYDQRSLLVSKSNCWLAPS